MHRDSVRGDTFLSLFPLLAVRIENPGVLTVGQSVTLTCSSDFSGDMISSIEWLSADSVVEDTPVLTFNPITDSFDDAIYICRVTHTNNTVYMQSVVLSVQGELLDVISVEIRNFCNCFCFFPQFLQIPFW